MIFSRRLQHLMVSIRNMEYQRTRIILNKYTEYTVYYIFKYTEWAKIHCIQISTICSII